MLMRTVMGKDLELHLLNDFQREFPLTPEPFAHIAHQLKVSEQKVLSMLKQLQGNGTLSRVGAVFRPNRVGASTLAAMFVPIDQLERVAAKISAYPEINHNYQREHYYNLWFVVTAPNHEVLSSSKVLYLPMLDDYHIDLGFDLTGNDYRHHAAGNSVPTVFTPQPGDDRLIAAIQEGLPLVSRPFAVVARCAGMSEVQVIERLRGMIESDVIKRFGIVVRHHELGFRANAMAVWDVPDDRVTELGRCLGRYPFITLCYRRQRQLPQWWYNLYCMVHGRDRDTVKGHLQQLRDECGMDNYSHELLFSVRRFKQCGAHYAETDPPRLEVRSA